MVKLRFKRAVLLFIGCMAAAAAGAQTAAAGKPNILFILLDDLDMSVWQTTLRLGHLPRIQRDLIDSGTTFTQTFAALSMCCPSRTTYLTGQYPHNHGVVRNSGPHGGFKHFAGDDETIAVWLHDAGYRTGLIGKYLNGYGHGSSGSYIPPGWDHWQVLATAGQYDYPMSDNGRIVNYGDAPEDYQTDVLARLAVAFVAQPDPRPFFLTLTPTVPHYETNSEEEGGRIVRPPQRYLSTPRLSPIPPESLPSFNEPEMRDKPQWMRTLPLVDVEALRDGYNSRIAALRALDDLVGSVLDAVRAAGRANDTLVVLTSDNGYQYGSHRLGAKTSLYEESIRLPMVVRTPGQREARVVDEWAMNTDWAPTLVDYAGAVATRVMDGRSLRSLATGSGSASARRTMLVEHPGDGRPLLNEPPYAMLRSRDPELTGDATGRVTLVYAETYDTTGRSIVDKEFYDLSIDPGQLDSLHKSRNARRLRQMSEMAARLARLKTCQGEVCRRLEN